MHFLKERIVLRKRFANSVNRYGNVLEVEHKIKAINNEDFKGDIYLNNYIKILEPYFETILKLLAHNLRK